MMDLIIRDTLPSSGMRPSLLRTQTAFNALVHKGIEVSYQKE